MMTKPREDLHKLPPIARAEAMDRPYRPSRRPMLYGLLFTLAINLGWGAWALFGSSGRVLPDWAKPQDILIPATLLPPRTTPPPPRVKPGGAAPLLAVEKAAEAGKDASTKGAEEPAALPLPAPQPAAVPETATP